VLCTYPDRAKPNVSHSAEATSSNRFSLDPNSFYTKKTRLNAPIFRSHRAVRTYQISDHCKWIKRCDWTKKEHILKNQITFVRLAEIEPTEIAVHMSDPRVAEHMPLLKGEWDVKAVEKFVASKEQNWVRDGLGHWAILSNGRYVGWGGFQRENDEWDFGLVLKPEVFGLGKRITKKAIEFAVAGERISFVTFLLPPSRKHLGALERNGAKYVGEIEYDGARFLKFRMETNGPTDVTSVSAEG
jgi:hypothetical protein